MTVTITTGPIRGQAIFEVKQDDVTLFTVSGPSGAHGALALARLLDKKDAQLFKNITDIMKYEAVVIKEDFHGPRYCGRI